MRSQKRLGLSLALIVLVGGCSQATPTETTVTTTSPASPTTNVPTTSSTVAGPEDWRAVDHPLVLAARASNSLESVTNAFDRLESTSWASGSDAPQWIELDLGEPRLIATVRLLVNQSPDGFTVHRITAGAHDVPGMLITTLDRETHAGAWIDVPIDKEVEFIRITTTESPSAVSWSEIDVVEAG